MRGSWRPNRTEIFWPPLLWPSTLCFSRSPDAQPEAQRPTLLSNGFLYCILSATSLIPKLHWGSRGSPRPGVAFPTTSRPTPTGTWTQLPLRLELAWLLGYIIVQRPLDRPLDLWNRMFERHQAEITVMQSVYESIMGFFSLSHFVSQFPPTRFPLPTTIGMCHFLPVHHLE